jgi:ATP-binding cassette, subfamily B, bacterial
MSGNSPRTEVLRVVTTSVRTLRLAWEASPRGFAGLIALTALAAILPLATVSVSRRVVNMIAVAPLGRSPILPWAMALAGLIVAQRIVSLLQGNRQQLFASAVGCHAERLFLGKTSRSDLARFDDPAWHDRLQRVSQDLSFRPYQLTSQTMGMLGACLTLLGMMGMLLALHPLLLALTLTAVMVPLPFQRTLNRRIWHYYHGWTAKEREQSYHRALLTDAASAKDLRAYVLEAHVLERQQALASERHRELGRIYASADRVFGLGGLVGGAPLVLAFALAAQWAARGRLTAGDLTALIAALASVTAQISSIFNAVGLIDQHAPFLESFFDFLRVGPLIEVPATPIPIPIPLRQGLVIDNVVFRYSGCQTPVLDHLSLDLRPGEMVALVGDNGAGKTTLVKLLLRFYDPETGAIRVDGLDLRQADPTAWRERVGVLFQDYTNFRLRARDAVAFGRISRAPTDEELWAALTAARADRVVRALPHRLDSFLGRLFERGTDLSGGEWQRLALARLMFRNADLWVVDEPTSSLDPEVEAAIFAELKQQLRGRMGIVISHRLSTVRIADRIALLQRGCVTELGTHKELMALGGRYAHLFELQAAGYR